MLSCMAAMLDAMPAVLQHAMASTRAAPAAGSGRWRIPVRRQLAGVVLLQAAERKLQVAACR